MTTLQAIVLVVWVFAGAFCTLMLSAETPELEGDQRHSEIVGSNLMRFIGTTFVASVAAWLAIGLRQGAALTCVIVAGAYLTLRASWRTGAGISAGATSFVLWERS